MLSEFLQSALQAVHPPVWAAAGLAPAWYTSPFPEKQLDAVSPF